MINQCDGCAAKMPLRNNIHIDSEGAAFMCCTKANYETPVSEASEEHNAILASRVMASGYVMGPDDAAVIPRLSTVPAGGDAWQWVEHHARALAAKEAK